MEESGTPLTWQEERETGEQTCEVRLRHFNSGRLLQIQLFKDKNKMRQVLTLAKVADGKLEDDGEGISAKKVLKATGKIQNYIFKLTNRATVDEMTLTKETVCNIKNDGTKSFITTQFAKDDGTADADEDEPEEEDMEVEDPENEKDSFAREVEEDADEEARITALKQKRGLRHAGTVFVP